MASSSSELLLRPAPAGSATSVLQFAFESLVEAGWPLEFAFPDVEVWEYDGGVHLFPHGVDTVAAARRWSAVELLSDPRLCDRCAREWMTARPGGVRPADPQRLSVWSAFNPMSVSRLGDAARSASRDAASHCTLAWSAAQAAKQLAELDELLAAAPAADQSAASEFREVLAGAVSAMSAQCSFRELPPDERACSVARAQLGPRVLQDVWAAAAAGDGYAQALSSLTQVPSGVHAAVAAAGSLADAAGVMSAVSDFCRVQLADMFDAISYVGRRDLSERAAGLLAERISGWVAAPVERPGAWSVWRLKPPELLDEWVAWQAAVRVFPNVALGSGVAVRRLIAFPDWFDARASHLRFEGAMPAPLVVDDPMPVLLTAAPLESDDSFAWDLPKLIGTAARIAA